MWDHRRGAPGVASITGSDRFRWRTRILGIAGALAPPHRVRRSGFSCYATSGVTEAKGLQVASDAGTRRSTALEDH